MKPEGKVLISDVRRDMFALVRWFLWVNTTPQEIRPGLISSINAAYTPGELKELLKGTKLEDCTVSSNLLGVMLVGRKKQ